MIEYVLSPEILGFMGIICLVFFLLDVYIIHSFWKKKALKVHIAVSFIASAYSFYIHQCLVYLVRYIDNPLEKHDVPLEKVLKPEMFYVISIAVLSVINVILISMLISSKKRSVALFSVKEAADNLPAAICFYDGDGRVLLKNRMMDEISILLTGEVMFNGKSFERMIDDKHHVSKSIMYIADSVIVKYKEKYYLFEKRDFEFNKEIVTELKAIDITEEYKESKILEEKQAKARELSEKVKKYRDNIRDLTIEEETLKAKIRIHDELGEELLSLKKYLILGGNDEELIRLYRLLRCNVGILNDERDTEVKNPYEKVLNTASNVGVSIEIDGELPREKAAVDIVAKAFHESVTNTLRHAKGDKVFVSVDCSGDSYVITIKNNGLQPKEEIKETGGLLQLRKAVERIKGNMYISCIPEMQITLVIGKENAKYGI